MTMRSRTALLSAVIAALGCACDSVPDAAVTDCDAQIVPGGAATDILFVVDDSGSMLGEQEELSDNLATFVRALLGSPVRLDLRIAVTNTSVTGYTGQTAYPAGAPAPVGTPFPDGAFVAVQQDPGGLVTPGNYIWNATAGWGGPRILSTGQMSADAFERDFGANVLVGIWGTGKEQPLRAMRRALERADVGGVNDGFLRPGARLAIVIVTDEDDCSESSAPIDGDTNDACADATNKSDNFDPLSDFVTLLDAPIVGESRDPLVAVIAGFDANLDPNGCSTAGGTQSYDDPTRLDAFVTALDAARPGRTFKDSICESFGATLIRLADRLVPQTVPLVQAPADWRMLAVSIDHSDGTSTPCPLAAAGSPEEATAGAVFNPPQTGAYASLSFQNGCRLGIADSIDLRMVCAR